MKHSAKGLIAVLSVSSRELQVLFYQVTVFFYFSAVLEAFFGNEPCLIWCSGDIQRIE